MIEILLFVAVMYAWLLFLYVLVGNRIFVNGKPFTHPILVVLAGPIIMFVIGVVFVIIGGLFASPIICFFFEKTFFAAVAYVLLVIISVTAPLNFNGKVLKNIYVRILFGPGLFMIIGLLFLAGGCFVLMPLLAGFM